QTNEPIILLFLGLCLELLERQLKFGGYVENTSIFLREVIENLQQLGADSARSILGAIGLVKKINFAPKFKLICNLVAVFCLNQFLIDGKNVELRITADQSLNVEKAKNQLHLLKNQRQYANLTAAIDLALEYCTNNAKTILNVHEFYSKLTLIFYNEKYLIDKCVA
uniref:Uncharacterized protein n=1 Tax=Romanomermis culicivorax TaxID=13658 RepID=A0A915JLW5_ROMCU